MSADAVVTRTRITDRFDELGVAASALEIQQLTVYFCLLAKWTAKINLTALPVASASNSAIDRLLVEPMKASRLVLPADDIAVDLGSGGGSPAFPMKIGAPQLRMVLVESRERKCAFLREVIRSLALTGVEVANTRFEALQTRSDLAGRTGLVTFRAVRPDESLWTTLRGLLRQDGRVFWFGAPAADECQAQRDLPPGFTLACSHVLVPASNEVKPSNLAVIQLAG